MGLFNKKKSVRKIPRPELDSIPEEELLKAVVLIDIAQKIGGEFKATVKKGWETLSIEGSNLQAHYGGLKLDLSVPGSLDKEKLEEYIKLLEALTSSTSEDSSSTSF